MRFAFALLALAALAVPADPRWIPLPDAAFEVDGLPWYQESKGALIRLPLSLEKVVRPPVWGLAHLPAGAASASAPTPPPSPCAWNTRARPTWPTCTPSGRPVSISTWTEYSRKKPEQTYLTEVSALED